MLFEDVTVDNISSGFLCSIKVKERQTQNSWGHQHLSKRRVLKLTKSETSESWVKNQPQNLQ